MTLGGTVYTVDVPAAGASPDEIVEQLSLRGVTGPWALHGFFDPITHMQLPDTQNAPPGAYLYMLRSSVMTQEQASEIYDATDFVCNHVDPEVHMLGNRTRQFIWAVTTALTNGFLEFHERNEPGTDRVYDIIRVYVLRYVYWTRRFCHDLMRDLHARGRVDQMITYLTRGIILHDVTFIEKELDKQSSRILRLAIPQQEEQRRINDVQFWHNGSIPGSPSYTSIPGKSKSEPSTSSFWNSPCNAAGRRTAANR